MKQVWAALVLEPIQKYSRKWSWFRQKAAGLLGKRERLGRESGIGHNPSGRGFVIAVLVLVAVSVWTLIYIPPWHVNERVRPPVRISPIRALELENEVRKTLTQIILGAFGLLVLYTTWRRMIAGDEAVRIANQGHITDRYTKAIEQLGKMENGQPNIEVRLGAIYALERIALDSIRDHQTVMEVLCAYVRRNAPPPTTVPLGVERPSDKRPRIDIQAILTVLGRRGGSHHGKPPMRVDLRGSHLRGADLRDAHLEGAHFHWAHMGKADLRGSHLVETVFWEAHLEGADFYKADMTDSYLIGAHLAGALFEEATLGGADLLGAHLEAATGLTVHQVKSAQNWERAHYGPEFRRELGLPDEVPKPDSEE